jgi:hypothetical protein
MRAWQACFVLLACSACSVYSTSFRQQLVRDRAVFDLDCGDLEVKELRGDLWGARGCGRRATYLIECRGGPGRRDLCDATMEKGAVRPY